MIAHQSRNERSLSPGSWSRGSSRSGCGIGSRPACSSGAATRMQSERRRLRSSCGIGAGRFELPASRPQTGRSDQAELRPDETQSTAASPLLGLDERTQLGELLAAQLVALAAFYAIE